MVRSDPVDLELTIARTRVLLPILAAASVYVDPTIPDLTPWFTLAGGRFAIDRYALGVLAAHLVYALVFYLSALGGARRARVVGATNVLDVVFAVAIAIFTEGRTSPAYVFFAFAILAVGCREGFRTTIVVTAACVVCYFGLISVSSAGESWSYEMRPAYLAITGYLIGVLGQERVAFETRTLELEATARRHEIARSLHDGYVQALAGVNLRLETCRERIRRGETERALAEVTELQHGVAREYDEVRRYVRSLAGEPSSPAAPSRGDVRFAVEAGFSASLPVVEQVLQILLEGARNVARHSQARTASLVAHEDDGKIRLTIEDDGAGLDPHAPPPWSIASRVAELGGEVRLLRADDRGARLAIDLPGGPVA